ASMSGLRRLCSQRPPLRQAAVLVDRGPAGLLAPPRALVARLKVEPFLERLVVDRRMDGCRVAIVQGGHRVQYAREAHAAPPVAFEIAARAMQCGQAVPPPQCLPEMSAGRLSQQGLRTSTVQVRSSSCSAWSISGAAAIRRAFARLSSRYSSSHCGATQMYASPPATTQSAWTGR